MSALVGCSTGNAVSHLSTSLLETALNLSVFQGQRAFSLSVDPTPQGTNHPTIAPYGTFTTAGEPINIAVGNDKQ
ncbi:MAG TPA: CoA transferase [Ktedonobacteraceae bacterium]|nr:CoA transferase [Ktedonobacteraceae bacterium]